MDFHIIHFDFDNQITAVNSSKVQCTTNSLKPGGRCKVPFETEHLTEDGRPEYKDVLYEGTIVCTSLGLYVRSTAKVIYGREKLRKKEKPVKKKAVELSKKGQEELELGTPLTDIIGTFQSQGKKRDSAGKLAEAIKALNSETPKTKSKPNTAGRTIKGAKQKKTTQKNEAQPSVSANIKTKIHPKKLAEISELLGDSDDISVTKSCSQLDVQVCPAEISISKQTPKSSETATSQKLSASKKVNSSVQNSEIDSNVPTEQVPSVSDTLRSKLLLTPKRRVATLETTEDPHIYISPSKDHSTPKKQRSSSKTIP